MLVPVAQQQARFVIPGLVADQRGVVFGRVAAAVLPSLDRVVLALAALTENTDLEDLYRALVVQRTRSSIGSTEFVTVFPAGDANLLDRVSTLTSLFGGELFTGDGRHMVRYRDRQSPLGYDVDRLAESSGELVLYGRLNEGSYRVEERLSLRQLILRVSPTPARRSSQGGSVLIACPPGLRRDLETHLWRSGVEAEVVMISATDAGSSGGHQSSSTLGPRCSWSSAGFLYRAADLPEASLALFDRSPGLGVFVPEGRHAAVERGYVHPFALHACGAALDGFGLHLFEGGRSGALVVEAERLEWTRLRSNVAASGAATVTSLRPGSRLPSSSLELRLHKDSSVLDRPCATFVQKDREPLLLRMLHLLPEAAMEGYRAAVLDDGVLILCHEGLRALPIGQPFVSFGQRILIPVGHGLRPRVAVERAAELLGGVTGRYIVFLPTNAAPLAVSEADFQPLGAVFLTRLAAEHAKVRSLPAPPGAGRVTFDPKKGFPLWGERGKAEDRGSGRGESK